MTEVGMVRAEIRHALKHVAKLEPPPEGAGPHHPVPPGARFSGAPTALPSSSRRGILRCSSIWCPSLRAGRRVYRCGEALGLRAGYFSRPWPELLGEPFSAGVCRGGGGRPGGEHRAAGGALTAFLHRESPWAAPSWPRRLST